MKVEFNVDIDYEKYGGKYIVIVGDKIVASGENLIDIVNEAKTKYPDKKIELMKVSEPGLYIFVSCK